jgi:hypothetical protein
MGGVVIRGGLWASLAFVLSCSGSGDSGRAPADVGSGEDGLGNAAGSSSGELPGGEAGPGAPGAGDDDFDMVVGVDQAGSCAGVDEEAGNKPAPIDIIWAIDTSGSMIFETAEVQANMNMFAEQIVNAGLDVHVVLISEPQGSPFEMLPPGFPPPPPGFFPKMGICIPAPLGTGDCPADTNLPNYLHVPETVNSSDSLRQLIMQYPMYKDSLRQKALKYFVVVTDDESSMPAEQFIMQVDNMDPGWFDSWRFFGVFCFDTMCIGLPPPCETPGNIYRQVVDMTGGLAGSLCMGQSDFKSVFDELAKQVITTTELACEWDIPPTPDGEIFRKDTVNVQYTPSDSGTPEDIYWVKTPADCGPGGGWYYDDNANPTKVQVCGTNCERMKVDINGKVDILFGCATIAAPD